MIWEVASLQLPAKYPELPALLIDPIETLIQRIRSVWVSMSVSGSPCDEQLKRGLYQDSVQVHGQRFGDIHAGISHRSILLHTQR